MLKGEDEKAQGWLRKKYVSSCCSSDGAAKDCIEHRVNQGTVAHKQAQNPSPLRDLI